MNIEDERKCEILNRHLNYLFETRNFEDFNHISEKRKDEIFDIVKNLKTKYLKNDRITLDTILIEKIFGNNTINLNGDELFVYLIAVIDENLEILEIFFDSTYTDEVKYRAMKVVPYYDQRLLVLEKSFNEKFPSIKNPLDNDKKTL